MKTSQIFYLNGFFAGGFFLHPDFNRAKIPSGGNELDELGGFSPHQQINRFQPIGTHLNHLLES